MHKHSIKNPEYRNEATCGWYERVRAAGTCHCGCLSWNSSGTATRKASAHFFAPAMEFPNGAQVSLAMVLLSDRLEQGERDNITP